MGLINVNTKLKRNALVKAAGQYFVDETSDIIKAVSYTHLNVYKRQVLSSLFRS